MKPRKMSPKEANLQSRAAYLNSREDYKKQLGLQMVTLRDIRVGKDLFASYNLKYWLE